MSKYLLDQERGRGRDIDNAIAATVSAVPLRIITLTGPVPHLPPADIIHSLPLPSGQDGEGEMRIMPHPHPPFRPCGGKKMGSSPFSDLLTRLGLVRPKHDNHGHGHEHGLDHGRFLDSAVFVPGDKPHHSHAHHGAHEHEDGNMMIEGWKHHVEEMFGGAKKILPIMEGGDVRILPVMEGDESQSEHKHGYHRHGAETGQGQHLRPHGGHHWRHKESSFGSRSVPVFLLPS